MLHEFCFKTHLLNGSLVGDLGGNPIEMCQNMLNCKVDSSAQIHRIQTSINSLAT